MIKNCQLFTSKFLIKSLAPVHWKPVRFISGLKINSEVITSETLAENVVNFPSHKSNNQLYAWGLQEHGALGLAKESCRVHTRHMRYRHKPVRHFFGETYCVTHVDCGFGFTAFAIKNDADLFKVFGTGINTDSQIGYHDPRTNHPLGILLAPAPICLGIQDCKTEVLSISAGRAHLVVVTDREGVFTLGSNCFGQCGRPIISQEKYTGSSYVHQIMELCCERVCSAVCGQDHTLFLTENGKVFSCGWGADGQTGLGHNENVDTPTQVLGGIREECIVKLVGKCDTVLALSNNGEVYGWGNTEYYQLTTKGEEKQFINCPRRLDKLKFAGKIIDIAAGGSFCLALNSCGDVYVWGYGILGLGPSVDQIIDPVKLPRTLFGCNEFNPDTRVSSVYCGLNHMAAINTDCNLFTWGKNSHGSLGIGHVRNQFFPYQVSIGANVHIVSCGVDHTMALCRPFVI